MNTVIAFGLVFAAIALFVIGAVLTARVVLRLLNRRVPDLPYAADSLSLQVTALGCIVGAHMLLVIARVIR